MNDDYITPWAKSYTRQDKEASRAGEDMTFSEALECMKQGSCVARSGWNGKNMFVWMEESQVIQADGTGSNVINYLAHKHGGSAQVLPYLCMRTATGDILFGWLASQTDMLASDWEVVTLP